MLQTRGPAHRRRRVTAVDVRIISATNVNLHKLVAAKRFRRICSTA
ncbi:MAG: sigma 54-interacting transcriptional regulator [Bilophila wadsworthia]